MSYCSNCGTKLKDGANFCPQCGAAVSFRVIEEPKEKGIWESFKEGWRGTDNKSNSNSQQNERIVYVQAPLQDIYVHSRKSKGLAMTLCFFLGWMGAHEFYLRNYFSGSLYLIFSWTLIPLLLSIIDFISLLITPKSLFHKMYDK